MFVRYMERCDEILEYFADIHRKKEAVPDVIVIQDIDFYADQSQVQQTNSQLLRMLNNHMDQKERHLKGLSWHSSGPRKITSSEIGCASNCRSYCTFSD